MLITKKSMLTGVEHTREIPVTRLQLEQWLKDGVLIQNAMPDLSDNDREFLLTGSTEEEWDKLAPPDDEDEDDALMNQWCEGDDFDSAD